MNDLTKTGEHTYDKRYSENVKKGYENYHRKKEREVEKEPGRGESYICPYCHNKFWAYAKVHGYWCEKCHRIIYPEGLM